MTQTPTAPRILLTKSYTTYPHSNGFYADGQRVVLGRIAAGTCDLLGIGLDGHGEELLHHIDLQNPATNMVCFDVSLSTGLLAATWDNAVWLLDLANPGVAECVYQAPAGASLNDLASIAEAGDRIVVGQITGDVHEGILIRLADGTAETILRKKWWTNHFHFCPHDNDWIGFSHEGATETIPDRIWAWHRTLAPEGKCVFDQRSDNPDVPLCVGHERWAFHDTSAYAVAYGVSPYGPRGVYEVFADGRAPRLVSGADRDWHCDVARDGRFAVVDTSGPYDRPGHGWEQSDGINDIVLIDTATGDRRFLARTQAGPRHPHHPHPVFSPDGRHILFNHTEHDMTPIGATMIIDLP